MPFLSGLRVLDLSRVLAGPLCTMMLADLGADVIKVERPETGDDTRGWGPPFDDRGESAYYLSVNRNKLSAALDFGNPRDCELIRALALDADVVVENFLPGALERRGLGAAQLLAANDRLLWCTISGFGAESARQGYDFVVQAEAGWMAITGEQGGAPMKAGVALADVIAGKDAASVILAAVAARAMGTLGTTSTRRLHVSLVHSATAALVNVAQNTLVSGRDAARWGNAHPNLCPYELFAAADRAVVIAVGTDPQWLECARVLGLEDLAQDEALRTNTGRLAQRDRVVSALAARLASLPAAHWIEALRAVGVPCGVVRTVEEAVGVVEASPLTGVHPLSPAGVRRAPPRLDEHGAAIRARGWAAFA